MAPGSTLQLFCKTLRRYLLFADAETVDGPDATADILAVPRQLSSPAEQFTAFVSGCEDGVLVALFRGLLHAASWGGGFGAQLERVHAFLEPARLAHTFRPRVHVLSGGAAARVAPEDLLFFVTRLHVAVASLLGAFNVRATVYSSHVHIGLPCVLCSNVADAALALYGTCGKTLGPRAHALMQHILRILSDLCAVASFRAKMAHFAVEILVPRLSARASPGAAVAHVRAADCSRGSK
eukprot:gnl/Chilomastix_cuspidata/5080.p1 GENE.gnl/Chilomastix_cuspidata/5080~~gnl/Chilomastix_cuspidata/5080.p1  ORF type:complete len:238 (-),score=54.13 gnl/Chilomastix_cuspidata/5080:683-1396(-)